MAATDSIVRYIITPDPNEKRYDLVIAVDKDDNGNVTINHKLLIESSDQIGMTETEAEIAAGSIFGECSNISAVLCLSARPGCMYARTWRPSKTLSGCTLMVVSLSEDRSEESALYDLGEAYLADLIANGPLISQNPQSI